MRYITQDYNEDGRLSFDEFSDLIDAFGNQLAADKVCILELVSTPFINLELVLLLQAGCSPNRLVCVLFLLCYS